MSSLLKDVEKMLNALRREERKRWSDATDEVARAKHCHAGDMLWKAVLKVQYMQTKIKKNKVTRAGAG